MFVSFLLIEFLHGFETILIKPFLFVIIRIVTCEKLQNKMIHISIFLNKVDTTIINTKLKQLYITSML